MLNMPSYCGKTVFQSRDTTDQSTQSLIDGIYSTNGPWLILPLFLTPVKSQPFFKKKQHPCRLSLGKARNPSPLEPAPKNIKKKPAIFTGKNPGNATCTFANAAVAMIFRTKGLEASMAMADGAPLDVEI